ncbi:non-oxidative hydroxyarylic acid decarboxylases subunit D [Tuberibacillus sp. Marseille-P3662]|uniref:non-oxidative hydroxyarylic acid decarboxylases subunit D n=1 Tax=Tuberibacillus sp. Marseille-P3662 TaxID=1965358 RepID=UPI000A1CDF1A|nr:non-oxidative hydroxyarylic acid decarboxylases subunit D [Tuberibacillus sp. Marseille-P3662]
MHICPRCESKKATMVSESPVQGTWEVYLCSVCLYTWRSSEPEAMVNPEKYNPAFKVDPEDVPNAHEVPAVPERLPDTEKGK